jgi:hypothetical protein
MILLVAPFDGSNPENSPFIAASKKIHLIIYTLSKIDEDLVLLNSSHWTKSTNNFKIETKFTYLNCKIQIITPPTFRFHFFGKLINLFTIKSIYSKVITVFGKPKFIWLYNAYAFESKFANYAKKCLKNEIKIILEFEDWHFARSRGINPKPFLDWFFWKKLLNNIDYSFTVNKYLQNKIDDYVKNNYLLPGLINNDVINENINNQAFSNNIISIGYFGGLTIEKGAKFILDLMKEDFNINIKFIICGNGDLSDDFRKFSLNYPNILEYYGTIGEDELNIKYKSIDIILNPHSDNNGVFPFKVIEALAMKKLLISTKLNLNGFDWLSDAIVFSELSITDFKLAINNSYDLFKEKKPILNEISTNILEKYSCNSLFRYLNNNIY